LRQDYDQFRARETEILVIAPDTLGNARAYFQRHQLPFPGLVSETLAVYDKYDVQSRRLSLGQRPGLFIVDKAGLVRYAYLGTQQWEIPPNAEVLAQLDELQRETTPRFEQPSDREA
jgi:peroxiredoxin